MAMLEGERHLTLKFLNEVTQAWVEMEYNRTAHRETGEPPAERFLAGPQVLRPSPNGDDLRRAFRAEQLRSQRRSDGTVMLEGVRFEVPTRFRHLARVSVRYARWDLSYVHMVDEKSGAVLAALYPLSREANADGRRRAIASPAGAVSSDEKREEDVSSGVAPLLREQMREYQAAGLPPAYMPLAQSPHQQHEEEE